MGVDRLAFNRPQAPSLHLLSQGSRTAAFSASCRSCAVALALAADHFSQKLYMFRGSEDHFYDLYKMAEKFLRLSDCPTRIFGCDAGKHVNEIHEILSSLVDLNTYDFISVHIQSIFNKVV